MSDESRRATRIFALRRRRREFRTAIAASLFLYSAAIACTQQIARPHILDISAIALYTHNCERSRIYYGRFLGLTQVAPSHGVCRGDAGATFRIGARQSLQILPEHAAGTDRLVNISLETDNAEDMRAYLASRGVAVPRRLAREKDGTRSFRVVDPQGHEIRFVQYGAGARALDARGSSMGESPISDRMAHVGLIVTSLPAEYNFYTNILGFTEIYRGSMTGAVLSWINLKVPDGDDYLEFMLYKDTPEGAQRGSAHHLCLQVANVSASVAELRTRAAHSQYERPMQIRVGINRRRQVNLFDPDGTRTELMEPHTIDGKPPVPSGAPPP